MKYVILTRGYKAIVDDKDYKKVNKYKWHALVQPRKNTIKIYACRKDYVNGHKFPIFVRMHRFIMECPRNLQVDHINNDGLDNRRKNLRLATNQQNQWNKMQTNKTGYKGVGYMPWVRGKKFYYAKIHVNGKNISLGYHMTAREAGIAYNEAATKHFGKFARLNIIPDLL